MNHDTVVDTWRIVNAVLALLAALLLTAQLWRIRHKAPSRILLLGMAQFHMLGVVVVAGVANVLFNEPLIGISMATTAIVWVLWAVLFTDQAYGDGRS